MVKTTGLSAQRLDRLDVVMDGYIQRGEIPGLVALVSRGDDLHVTVHGKLGIGHKEPMQRDSIFRIASLTKVVVAVAAMILVDECRLHLDEAIDPWVPELANRLVLKTMFSEVEDTVPAPRAISVRDVLTYRMGFGSVTAMPDTYPI